MRHREHGVSQGQPGPRTTWTLLSWIWIAEERGSMGMELARMGSGRSSQACPPPPQMLQHCWLDFFSVPLQICSSLFSGLLWLWTVTLSSFVFRLQSGLANGSQPQELWGESETPVFILKASSLWSCCRLAEHLNLRSQFPSACLPHSSLSLPPCFSPLGLGVVTLCRQC